MTGRKLFARNKGLISLITGLFKLPPFYVIYFQHFVRQKVKWVLELDMYY